MENNTHPQLPENLIVVDKGWLEKQIEMYTPTDVLDYNPLISETYQDVLSNSFPLTPILEEAWSKSIDASLVHFDIANREVSKQSYLSQPITLKKK